MADDLNNLPPPPLSPDERPDPLLNPRPKIVGPAVSSKRKRVLVILLLTLAIAGAGYFLKDKIKLPAWPFGKKVEAPEKGKREDAESAAEIPLKAFKVARFNYEDALNALGTIKGAVEFKLSFEIPGIINSINYREGERYEEGALLISLKQDDVLLRLQKSQAQLKKAETAQSLAQKKVTEHERLFQIGAIPQGTLDKVKLEFDSAVYDVQAADLEVKANESVLEKSNLYAPSDGMIGELMIEEGENVTPNSLLGSHVQIDYVQAEFGIVERNVSKVQLGLKARVYVDAYPDKVFEGVIDNISPVVTGSSRTASARIRIENPDSQLLPGMFARIRIVLFSKQNTIAVPAEAIQGGEDDAWVYVVDEAAATVSKRPIQIGYRRPDYVQIDVGLEEGELVAMSSFDRLEEGAKIRIIEKQEGEM